MTAIADFTLESLRGTPLPLAAYAGKPLLIVNTASLCGFTGQYAGLQELWTEYRERGLTVLAVPSNDFGKQEPGDADSIGAVCDARFRITFPVAAKAVVSGSAAIPLFHWLGQSAGPLGRPRWNFYKYLIGRDGQLADWFGSVTTPGATRLRRAIERCL
ncbi:MAG: glutathione peroxidase [Janthinobacterium lividum]